ncbi:MAG: phosphate/phosphite/phosphonate ABC transporter substrate-binding protein [Gammaproteobacteria bacterium]|nr:phosphate/phosphite/phosphonate ABC transporter substrate-binding protein [Gammaproteobacteria bacterium]
MKPTPFPVGDSYNDFSNKHRSVIFFAMLILALLGCNNQQTGTEGPQYANEALKSEILTYRFAIHPLHNPKKLTESYQPLIDYLNEHVKTVRFQVEASRDYQAYEAKFRNKEAEFLLPNPWQTLEAMKVGYSVMAMAGDAEDFKGIYIVRKDGNIHQPRDLKGKAVSYPSPTALAACIMPQQFLHDNGLNATRDVINHYVGSQESSIMNVYLKETAAGATWPPPWRAFQKDHPEEAAQLQVIWETPPLINNSVMARNDIPSEIRMRVRELLTSLEKTDEGLRILKGMETARFHAANDDSYDKVRQFVESFEKNVRLVEEKI